jgi:hypothetical protein
MRGQLQVSDGGIAVAVAVRAVGARCVTRGQMIARYKKGDTPACARGPALAYHPVKNFERGTRIASR